MSHSKKSQALTKKAQDTKTIVATSEKVETQKAVVVKKEDQINNLLGKLNKLENLKNYYSKLKVKQKALFQAYEKMNNISNEKKDHFEEGSSNDFPFEIVLKGKVEYDRMEEIFKISKRDTVTRFTEFLLNQLNDLIEAFEADLIHEAEKGNI